MGVAGALAQRYLPSDSAFTTAILPSIPFLFIAVFLLLELLRGRTLSEETRSGGPLDAAIRPHRSTGSSLSPRAGGLGLGPGIASAVALITILVLAATLAPFWAQLVGLAMAFGVAFLGSTLVTGEGGMIWLCQITFAGVGAISTSVLATRTGWPLLAAILAGGAICAVLGALIGVLTIRMGDLYVALVTLTFGLLVENVFFRYKTIYGDGTGIALSRPDFLAGPRAFGYFAVAVFCVCGVVIVHIRRTTMGLALGAVRSSAPAARTTGLSVLQVKVLVAALAAFVTGIGGGLLALYAKSAIPDSYATIAGLVWIAVIVNFGIRSVMAAAVAGMVFAFFPALVIVHLSSTWGNVPAAMFGVGAVMAARHPDGVLAAPMRNLERRRARRGPSPTAMPLAAPSAHDVPGPDRAPAAVIADGNRGA
jgi:branched-chain amino acid transport system permease protein